MVIVYALVAAAFVLAAALGAQWVIDTPAKDDMDLQ